MICGKGGKMLLQTAQREGSTGDSKSQKPKPVAAPARATSHKSDLSHIAPGLRQLAVPVAELSLMVGNPRSHPAKNLEAIKAALVAYGQVETWSTAASSPGK
jgi:hypothetical protein